MPTRALKTGSVSMVNPSTFNENSAVAQPSGMQALGAPELRLGREGGRQSFAVIFFGQLAKEGGSGLPQEARGSRHTTAEIGTPMAISRPGVTANFGMVHQENQFVRAEDLLTYNQ